MRWSQQSLEGDPQMSLPGYRDAVVRHFDAPEAIDTRFYEVRAKTILNRVPEMSQVPFRWTVNPYRGCTHACLYCVWGGTPVLMADGSHRKIELVQPGDRIYGTEYQATYRRFVTTEILDKWVSIKPAYRVLLTDGTELVASGDHRFLSNRGWKYVINSPPGARDRPHLTPRSYLLGTGQFSPQPAHGHEYRRGYLCGIVRGDGTLGSYRLALADLEALTRARKFLDLEQLPMNSRVFSVANERHRAVTAIYSGRRSVVERIAQIIEWPELPNLDSCRGFLAGIFDAEGSRSASALRISNTEPLLLQWIEACARRLAFDTILEDGSAAGRASTVRIRGGLHEHLRFFHLTDPAITRKRSIEGEMVKTFKDLRVESVEPLGELPLYDITTGTGDFIANGVVSHNCFARPTHEFLGWNANRDFEREIVVKVNAPERLRVELAKPSWEGEHVALGTNTDPYQWVEGRYELMRGIWEALRDARNPCSVLTKSPLLLRDLDLMRELDEVTDFSAALSIPTLEPKAWRQTEPRTPNPKARLDAVAELSRAGIRTGVLVAPLMPGINDSPKQVAEVVRLATEAGASYITGIALHLRKGVREVFMHWLAENRPELTDLYEDLYRRGAYAPPAERRRLARLIEGHQLSIRDRNWRRGGENNSASRFQTNQFARESDQPKRSRADQLEPPAPRLF